jgi:hypothetical protein
MENKKNITGDDLAHRAEMELNSDRVTMESLVSYLRSEARELDELRAAAESGKTEVEGIFGMTVNINEAVNAILKRLEINCQGLKDLPPASIHGLHE